VPFPLEIGIPELTTVVDVIVDGSTDDDDTLPLTARVDVARIVERLGPGVDLGPDDTLAVPLSWRRSFTSWGVG
jgi:hypothetical protein